jgi:hypothetical protein
VFNVINHLNYNARVTSLLGKRQIVGASIGQFGGNSTQVFFVTWFPTYLVTAREMTFIQAGFMTSLPYIGASIGVIPGGLIVRRDSEAIDGVVRGAAPLCRRSRLDRRLLRQCRRG